MYRDFHFVFVLLMKVWKKTPKVRDTLANLQKFSILPWWRNQPKNRKSTRFIWVFIILSIYNFVSILNLALARTGIPMGCNKTLDHVQTRSKKAPKKMHRRVFFILQSVYKSFVLPFWNTEYWFSLFFTQITRWFCDEVGVVSKWRRKLISRPSARWRWRFPLFSKAIVVA